MRRTPRVIAELIYPFINMKTLYLTLISALLYLPFANADASSKVAFTDTKKGASNKTTCTRNGKTIYEYILIKRGKKENYSLYRFFWNGKLAATVLTVGREPAIQQVADLPVSFTIYLDHALNLSLVTIERPDGKVIDGFFRKKDRLFPADTDQLSSLP